MLRFQVFLTTFLFASSLAAAQSAAHWWLERMNKAVQQLNYDGNFVYVHDNNIEALRIVHTVENGEKKERIFSLNGEAREIIRDNNTVTCILPQDKAINTTPRPIKQKHFAGFFDLKPENLKTSYQVEILGEGRVADRVAKIISFAPKDALRYGYRLYLDDEHGLPLQWDMFDQDNQRVSSIMFTSLQIGEQVTDSGDLLKSDLPPIVKVLPNEAADDAKQEKTETGSWRFTEIPAGFELKHFISQMPRHKNRQVEHYIFSDGMASFSVYIEKTQNKRLNGGASLGALNAFGTHQEGHQITAVGEVPEKTLKLVIEVMKPNAGNNP